MQSAPRAADIDALEPCELFKLGRADFEDMMRMFPGSRAYMDRVADARLAVLRWARGRGGDAMPGVVMAVIRGGDEGRGCRVVPAGKRIR